MRVLLIVGLVLAPLWMLRAQAGPTQHEQHGMSGDSAGANTSAVHMDSTSSQQDPGHPGMEKMQMTRMMARPLGIPAEREGSGTSWLPDVSPMYAVHRMAGPWELML